MIGAGDLWVRHLTGSKPHLWAAGAQGRCTSPARVSVVAGTTDRFDRKIFSGVPGQPRGCLSTQLAARGKISRLDCVIFNRVAAVWISMGFFLVLFACTAVGRAVRLHNSRFGVFNSRFVLVSQHAENYCALSVAYPSLLFH